MFLFAMLAIGLRQASHHQLPLKISCPGLTLL